MRFQIIRDVELAKELAKDDLLWWVSKKDGGCYGAHLVVTCRYGRHVVDSHIQAGTVGIRIED